MRWLRVLETFMTVFIWLIFLFVNVFNWVFQMPISHLKNIAMLLSFILIWVFLIFPLFNQVRTESVKFWNAVHYLLSKCSQPNIILRYFFIPRITLFLNLCLSINLLDFKLTYFWIILKCILIYASVIVTAAVIVLNHRLTLLFGVVWEVVRFHL